MNSKQGIRSSAHSAMATVLATAVLIAIATPWQANAQVRAQYDFTGGSAASSDSDLTTNAGVLTLGTFSGGSTSPAISSGTGTVFARANATGADAASGDTLAEAIANDAYFGFTFDPLAETVDLSSLQYDYSVTSPGGLDFSVSLLSSVDGFADTNVLDTFTFSGLTGGATPTQTQIFDLSSLTGFTGLTAPVEFRWYYTDNSNASSRIHRLDNVTLTSDVILPPIEWLVDGDEAWSTATSWSSDPDLPGSGALVGRDVLFGAAITQASVVTLDTSAELNRIIFSSPNSYTIADDTLNPGVNAITLTGDAEVQVSSGSHTINAVIAGSAGLVKAGNDDLVLGGDNTYTGATDIQAGLLRVTNIASINDTVSVASGAQLVFQGDADSTGAGFSGAFSPDITGDGTVSLSNTLTTETVTFANAKSNTGLVSVNGGTLVVSDAGALGSGATTGTAGADRTVILGDDNTGKLQLAGGVTVTSETLDLNARTTGNAVAQLSNLSGNNTWGGEVNLDNGAGDFVIESQADLLTISGNVIDADDVAGETSNLVLTGAGNGAITGSFVDLADQSGGPVPNENDNIAVTKRGVGTWTIATASSDPFDYYGGNTTVEEGTLAITAGAGDTGEVRSPVIAVNSGATLDVSSFGQYTIQIGQSLQGAGTVNATGVRHIGAASIKPGDAGIGTLTVDGDLLLTNLVAGDANSVADPGIEFELSNVLTAGGTDNDLIAVTGNLNIDNSLGNTLLNIVPTADGLATGNYVLIDYDTLSGAGAGGFTPQLVDSQGNPFGVIRQTLGVVNDAVEGQIELQVSGAAGNLVWTGAVTNAWDTGDGVIGSGPGTANWDNGGADEFLVLDNVTFDDTATSFTVDIATEVLPSSTTFNNNTNAYTITGAAGVGGGSLTANGTAGITLDNTGNNFSSIAIGAGATLTLGDGVGGSDTIGSSVDIANDGELVLNEEAGETGAGETLNGVISGSGVVRAESSNLTLGGANTYTGETIVDSTLLINNTDTGTPLGDVAGGTTVNAGGVLRANGETGAVAEAVTLNGGTLIAGGGTNSSLTWSGPITVGAAAGAQIAVEGNTDTFEESVRVTNGLTISGNVSGSNGQDLELTAGNGSTLVVSGAVGHDGGLRKEGAGTVELTAANTYTGDTNITSGTVALVDGGSIASSPNINVTDGGILDVSGTTTTYTIASGQTLSTGPSFSAPIGGSIVAADGFDFETGLASGSVTGPIAAGSGSTIEGLGDFTGTVTAQNGSVVRIGTDGIASGFSGPTSIEDFEGFATGVALTGGVDQGITPGWTLIDIAGNAGPSNPTTTDVVFEVIPAEGQSGAPADLVGTSHTQLLAVTSTDYDRLLATNGDNIAGSFAIAPATIDTSNSVDIVEADLIFDGAGDTSGQFLDVRVFLDYVDENNNVQLSLTRGATSGANTEIDLRVFSDGNSSTIFDGFSTTDFSAGFDEDTPIQSKLIHDVTTGFLSFELSQGGSVLASGFAVSDTLKTAGTGRVGFGSNNDAFAIDNVSVTTQAGVNAEGVQELTIDGDFALDAGAILEIDLLSTETYDKLAVSGGINVGGTLDVNLSGGFEPVLGDSFDILDFTTALGSLVFDLPALAEGLDWDTSAVLTTGILTVIDSTVGLAGDYNGDGMVTALDYSLWRSGASDDDTLAGYNAWAQNFGASSPATAAATTANVPEPTTLLLALAPVAVMAHRRCK